MPDQDEGIAMGSGDIAGVDVDSVLSGVESSGNDLEMTAPTATEPKTQAPTIPTEFVLNAKGEQIKVPVNDPRVTQWLQQGRDYSQNMAALKAKETEWQTKIAEADKYKNTYSQIDEWAIKNPEAWNKFSQSFSQFQQNQGNINSSQSGNLPDHQNDPVMREIAALKQQMAAQLQPVAKSVSDLIQEKESAKIKEEDQQLDAEIKSIREKHSSIDWNTPNAEGKTLEAQVLEHANKQGIKNFNTAFRDFYHDQLMNQAEQRGKESVSKELQKRTKLGLLGETSAPKKALTEATNLKSKSYDDLLSEAYEELGIG